MKLFENLDISSITEGVIAATLFAVVLAGTKKIYPWGKRLLQNKFTSLLEEWKNSKKRKSCIRRYLRSLRLKHLKKLKNTRNDDLLVAIQAIKEASWLAIFILSTFLGPWFMVTNSEFISSKSVIDNIFGFLLFTGPVIVVEILCLNQREFSRELIKSRNKRRGRK